MGIMVENNHFSWRGVLATALWLVAAAGGLTLLMALEPILYVLGRFTLSYDVTSMVMDRYRLHTVRLFGLAIYGAVWLAGIILLNGWFSEAKTNRKLWRRFGLVAGIEAAIWGLAWFCQEVLFGII